MSETFTVAGMACEHCADTVESALESVDGVTGATVDHDAGTATVDGDAAADELVAAVENAGYEATLPWASPAP